MARLAFLGTPDPAVPALHALLRAGHQVALVVSQPDRRRGRGATLEPSPVKRAALQAGLAVTDRLDDVLAAGVELGVVVAYGRLVPQRVLDVVPMVNVHFSLLPRWRGAAPVERAILAGDDVTGVCLMRLEAGLDTGPVLARESTPVGADETAPELTARLADMGARLLVTALADGVGGLGPGDPQVGDPTYAAKIEPAELRVDWTRPADEVVRLVRLGRAFTTWRGQRLRVLRAIVPPPVGGEAGPVPVHAGVAPGTGVAPDGGAAGFGVAAGDGRIVRVLTVQAEGRRPVDAGDWWRGARPEPGERLGGDSPDPVGSAGDRAG